MSWLHVPSQALPEPCRIVCFRVMLCHNCFVACLVKIQVLGNNTSTTPTRIFGLFLDFWDMFLIFMGHFWVRRGFKMILSHRAPPSLNMSSYRAIWTHFRPNFIFFLPKNLRSRKIQTFPKMQISSSSHSHKYLTYMRR